MTLSNEANEVLDWLVLTPQLAHKAITRSLLREILLHTDGSMISQGRVWTIKAKNMGAGVHRISLELET